MIHVVAPEIDPGGDVLIQEDMLQAAGIFLGLVFPGALAHTNDDAALAVPVQKPGVVHAGQVVHRGVEIHWANIICRPNSLRSSRYSPLRAMQPAKQSGCFKNMLTA